MSRSSFWLLAVTVGAPAFAAKPQIQWNDDYDFSSVRTFQWQAPPADSLAETDPFLHSRIVNTIEYELTGYGLTEVDASADVYVTYHASSRRDVNLESDTIGYSYGAYGTDRWGLYGFREIDPVVTSTRIIEVQRGTLVVDIVDAATDELVWRGTATDIVVSDDPAKNQKMAEKVIRAMAKQSRKLRER